MDEIARRCGVYQNKGFESTYESMKNGSENGIGLKGNEPLLVGLAIGALIMLIMIIPMNDIINNISIKTNQEFREQFPMWRGASYWLFYMWLIGCNFLFYETSQINYKLIFYMKGHKLKPSRSIFLTAAIFSFIYIGFFILFIMEISGVIDTKFKYFAQIFWLVFFGYLFIPHPSKWRNGGLDIIHLLWMMLVSPLPGKLLNFPVLFMSDQVISWNQPVSDIFYTICYTATKDSRHCLKLQPDFSFGYVVVVVIWRVAQVVKLCLMLYRLKSPRLWDPLEIQWIALARAFFGVITAASSFLYRLKIFGGAFPMWIAVASVSTVVSWLVDVKGDWGLLDYKHGTILR